MASLALESSSLTLSCVHRGGAGSPGRCWSLALLCASEMLPKDHPLPLELTVGVGPQGHRALLYAHRVQIRVLAFCMHLGSIPVSAWEQVRVWAWDT